MKTKQVLWIFLNVVAWFLMSGPARAAISCNFSSPATNATLLDFGIFGEGSNLAKSVNANISLNCTRQLLDPALSLNIKICNTPYSSPTCNYSPRTLKKIGNPSTTISYEMYTPSLVIGIPSTNVWGNGTTAGTVSYVINSTSIPYNTAACGLLAAVAGSCAITFPVYGTIPAQSLASGNYTDEVVVQITY